MAGLKWNTGKLYYSTVTVELGYQQFLPFGNGTLGGTHSTLFTLNLRNVE